MTDALVADVRKRLAGATRPITVASDRPIAAFEQYGHLQVVERLLADDPRDVARAVREIERLGRRMTPLLRSNLVERIELLRAALEREADRRRALLEQLGQESLLKVDVAISRPGVDPIREHLIAALSLKWSFRTDRAQDPRVQGSKLASLRRGRMPHFAVVTMEPRPSMLKIIGHGSGDVDFVYHLALPELRLALGNLLHQKQETASGRRVSSWSPAQTFRRLVENRRVLDYDDMVSYLTTL